MLSFKNFGKRFLNFTSFNSFNTFNLYPKSTSLFKYQKLSFSSVYVNHRDTPDNNDDTPFDFTPENYKKVEEIMVNNNKNNYNDVNNNDDNNIININNNLTLSITISITY